MEKEENVQKLIIDSFKFIPYNVTPEMKLENPLSESIQKYLSAGQTFNDTVVGTPKTWSGEKVGTALLEQYIGKEEWDDVDNRTVRNAEAESIASEEQRRFEEQKRLEEQERARAARRRNKRRSGPEL